MEMYLKEFSEENSTDYIALYKEFIQYNSDLVPDILDIKCENNDDYHNLLKEIENRRNGNHIDKDWYHDGYYYLAYDNNELIGLGCIRNNLTEKAYEIWGNIAYGIRPTKRKMGYGTKIAMLLVDEAKGMGIKDIILCHYETNEISPKIFNKIGAKYLNTVISPYSGKTVLRYIIK